MIDIIMTTVVVLVLAVICIALGNWVRWMYVAIRIHRIDPSLLRECSPFRSDGRRYARQVIGTLARLRGM